MQWYKDIIAILEGESEAWLAYLFGQQLENLPHLTRTKPTFRGALFRLCRYFFFMLWNLRLKQPAALQKPVEFFFFSGTHNQMSSLESTISFLKQKERRLIQICPRKFLKTEEQKANYTPFCLTLGDIAKSLVLLSSRGPSLYKKLKRSHPAAIQNYFDTFCITYTYLVFFQRIIHQLRPELVITANDHNPENRSLLAVSHYMGVETAYVQHASVSRLFPALRVNYAFLDGKYALDIYRDCEKNKPTTKRKEPTPRIILSGQKKKLYENSSQTKEIIGIALNALSNTADVINLVKELASADQFIRVRCHPGQADSEVRQYTMVFNEMSNVQISYPKKENVDVFLKGVRFLIAGDSSIHLEAALSGVFPIYYELSRSDLSDYYEYVKNGLARKVDSVKEILEIVNSCSDGKHPNEKSIQYYSATYRSEWEGREGELTGSVMIQIIEGHLAPPISPESAL